MPCRAGDQAAIRVERQDQWLEKTERAQPCLLFFGDIDENSPLVGLDEFHSDISRLLEEISDYFGGAFAL